MTTGKWFISQNFSSVISGALGDFWSLQYKLSKLFWV